MTVSFFIMGAFVALAVVFILGKGDKLIAGYNTASKEEREKVDIRRLRILMAVITIFAAAYCCVLAFFKDNIFKELVSTGVFMLFIVVCVILANTWARKK